MWRALLELAGAGKRGALFEEAVAMTVVRVLRGAMEDHPVIVASRTRLGAEGPPRHLARMQLLSAPSTVEADAPMRMRLRLANNGAMTWTTAMEAGAAHVRLGVQLLDANHRLVNRDFFRQPLPRPVAPGEQVECDFLCPGPPSAGVHYFKFDLVLEGVTWFEVGGSQVVVHRVEVG
jgi:hypothetical protein